MTTTTTKRTCVEEIMPDGWHLQTCGNAASVEHEGKWYCKRHDPAKRAAKRARKEALWKARSAESDAQESAEQLEQQLIELLCNGSVTLRGDAALIEGIRRARKRLDVAMKTREALEKR